MLARYSPEQHEFFPENEAAVYYRTAAEIDDKIDWVLCDPELRARIRRNAARLAAEQTYDARAAHVLRECGLSVSDKPKLENPRRLMT
jgi:spore maturation protein CgeB